MNDTQICKIQDALLSMPIGATGVRFGVVVTRWAKYAFEVKTFGKDLVRSETAAEDILKEQRPS